MVILYCDKCKSVLAIDVEDFNRSKLKELLIRDGVLSDSGNNDKLLIKFKDGCPACTLKPGGEIEILRIEEVFMEAI